MQHERWMAHALELAFKARDSGEVPIGAVVVRDETIVGEGWNQSVGENDATAHAEIIAVREAGKLLGNYRLNDCSLYVTLEPCVMCAGAVVHARMTHLVFGAHDAKAGAAGSIVNLVESPLLNHQCGVVAGVLEGNCKAVLQDFFRDKR